MKQSDGELPAVYSEASLEGLLERLHAERRRLGRPLTREEEALARKRKWTMGESETFWQPPGEAGEEAEAKEAGEEVRRDDGLGAREEMPAHGPESEMPAHGPESEMPAHGPPGEMDARAGAATEAPPQASASPEEARAARIVAIANQKGGVGKSTTAINLGAYLALEGKRVLVVDLDPQSNATSGLGAGAKAGEEQVYDVLVNETPIKDIIVHTSTDGLDLAPSSLRLAGAEVELVSVYSREGRLKKSLEPVRAEYDIVLVDCPPSLGLLTVNALAAADEVMIPIQCEYYALEGLVLLLRTIEKIKVYLNPDLRIGGILLTMHDARTNISRQVMDEVRKQYPDETFVTVIPRNVRLSEAPSYGQPISQYDPLSRGARAYRELAKEVISNG